MAIKGIYNIFNEKWNGQTVWIVSDTHFGDKELAAGISNRPSDEELIKLINSKVGRKDVLIHLGDVGNIECAKKLRGYKVLICGNHDRGHTLYEEVFDEVYAGPLIIGEKLILSHEPLNISWALNLHGHEHQDNKKINHYNCCLDVTKYNIINLNQLVNKSGLVGKVASIHRTTINKATKRKKKRRK